MNSTAPKHTKALFDCAKAHEQQRYYEGRHCFTPAS